MVIEAETVNLLKDRFNIDPETTAIMLEEGLLDACKCRNELIRREYKSETQPKHRLELRSKLADKYCVSVSLIEKIVLQQIP